MISSQPLDQPVRDTVSRLISGGQETGVQVVAYVRGTKMIDLAMGTTEKGGATPVATDTLFSIFSVVKGLAAFSLHILADRGLLDFDAPVCAYWPDFSAHGKSSITVRDVLTHRAGIPQMPAGVTPESMCDWEWMTEQIARLEPILRPGVDNAYMAMTFGWIVGEIVRRVDPKRRRISAFIDDEVNKPLRITDLYLSLPPDAHSRYATHTSAPDPSPPEDSLTLKAMPSNVRLVPEVFSRRDVLSAEIPAVNGVASARGVARFYAMIANEGELDGVRIVSRERVRSLLEPRGEQEEFEPVLMRSWRLSRGGFFLASENKPAAGRSKEMVFGMGMGGSIAWADMKTGLAVAITHNQMLNARSAEADPILMIANSVRESLGLQE